MCFLCWISEHFSAFSHFHFFLKSFLHKVNIVIWKQAYAIIRFTWKVSVCWRSAGSNSEFLLYVTKISLIQRARITLRANLSHSCCGSNISQNPTADEAPAGDLQRERDQISCKLQASWEVKYKVSNQQIV